MQLALDPRADAVDALHAATALYTSSSIVDSLLDRTGWPNRKGRLLDPSSGDGSFLLRALSRIETPPGDMEAVCRIRGWEIHPLAASHSREAIAALLTGRGWTAAAAERAAFSVIREGDFLTDTSIAKGEFSIIAGNPPYLRYGHLPSVFKDLYEQVVAPHARNDILHSFLDRCVDLLSDEGVIAFVSADRWLFNATTAKLRELLGQKVGLSHVARLDPTTSFYRPKYRRRGSPPRIHPVEIVLTPQARFVRPLTAGAISPDEGCCVTAPVGSTLADVATVRIAPWLGPEGIWVLDEAEAAGLTGASTVPAVDTDDIVSPSDVLAPPRRRAILTTRGEEPTGTAQAHLQALRHRMPKKCEGKPYWLPPEVITLDLSRPALLIPRIARRLRVIPLPAGILPINHNLQVVNAAPGVSLERVAEMLGCEESQEWIRRHAPRLENGFFSITTTLLRRLPLPRRFCESQSFSGDPDE